MPNKKKKKKWGQFKTGKLCPEVEKHKLGGQVVFSHVLNFTPAPTYVENFVTKYMYLHVREL